MTDYFAAGEAKRAEGAVGVFASVDDQPEVEAAPGVHIRAVSHGTLMLSYVRLDPDSVAATHTHPEEQMGIVLSGRCVFDLDGEERTLRTNDTYHAPPGVPHGCRTEEEACEILDVFTPPRGALLELIGRARG